MEKELIYIDAQELMVNLKSLRESAEKYRAKFTEEQNYNAVFYNNGYILAMDAAIDMLETEMESFIITHKNQDNEKETD